ncbi:hypothetical protein SEA_BRUHMOMENT_52 [Arthrobacter phage BruhMoment]|nr:hypothetical protein SEA_BRUHMOMENT_52 [Arthrobacter phage BruhMoment]
MAGKLSQFEMLELNERCPCGHDWPAHTFEEGCLAGWEYNGPDPGIPTRHGCMCQLAHTEYSPARHPRREY